MENAIIPHNYETWHHCITVDCDIKLTETFIKERIASLQNNNDFRTKQFVKIYGQHHLNKVLSWFKQAQSTL